MPTPENVPESIWSKARASAGVKYSVYGSFRVLSRSLMPVCASRPTLTAL